jgi:hypothetical protein
VLSKTAGFTPYDAGSGRLAGGTSRPVLPRPASGITGNSGRGRSRWGDVAALATVVAFSCSLLPATAQAQPCAKHEGKARAACIQHRAAQDYPPRPTWSEALARMTDYEEATLLRIGTCEMGTQRNDVRAWGIRGPRSGPWASLRWGVDYPVYSTAFGIANVNGAYIRSRTGGYAFPGRTPAEEVLGALALAKGPARGFSGWGCY